MTAKTGQLQAVAQNRPGGPKNGQDRLTTIQSSPIEPALLSVSEAARYCGISRALFYSLCADGTIAVAPIRLSSRVLYPRKLLDKWIDAGAPSRPDWRRMRDREGRS